jgi:uncharacterized protein YwqG
MKPVIQIKTHKDISLSKSFFGGLPECPSDFEWPSWDATALYLDEIEYAEETGRACNTEKYWDIEIGRIEKLLQEPIVPLIFLGQIYLEEIPRYDNFPNLPDNGILYFFWDLIRSPAAWRSSSKRSCRVIYIKDISELDTLSFPWDTVREFRNETEVQNSISRCSLTFKPAWTSSNYLDTVLEIDFEDEERYISSIIDAFSKETLEKIPPGFPERNESTILIKDHSSYGEPMHFMFGNPMEVQNPMEENCQLSFHGFNALEHNVNCDPEVAHLKEGVKDWQLLLQFDSDDNLDLMWGDAGMLYFWIRKQDLEKRDFSNVWCEMQCT